MTSRHSSPIGKRTWLLAAMLALVLTATIRADDPADPKQQLIGLRLELLEAQAKLYVADWELRVPPASEEPNLAQTAIQEIVKDDKLQISLKQAFDKPTANPQLALEKIKKDVERDFDLARQHWSKVIADSIAFQEEVASAQSIYEFDWRDKRLPQFDLGFIGWAVVGTWGVMMFACIALCVHETRRGFRRGRRLAAIILLPISFVVGGCSGGVTGDAGVFKLDRELTTVRQNLKEANQKLADIRRQADEKRTSSLYSLESMLGKGAAEAFKGKELQACDDARFILQRARQTELMGQDALAKIDVMQTDRKTLNELVEQSRSRSTQNKLIRIGGCIVLGLTGFAPLFMVRRWVARRRRRESRICPRCLEENTLASVFTAARDNQGRKISFVECSNKKCRYRFPSTNLRLPRLSFPAAGFKSSGKTQWLLTVLDQVSNGQVPVPAALEIDMTQVLPQIKGFLSALKRREPPQASVYGLPEPLTFVCRDADHWGPTRALVSLFDFAGKMMDQSFYGDEYRRRALLTDGFLLFLDPTQLDPDPNEGTVPLLDVQKEQVTNFYLDLCKARGLEDGDVVRVPVAVCVSKFDLLVSDNPIGEQSRRRIAELRKIRPEKHLTLGLLRRRSDLCKSMLPIMFQGWEVDDALRKRFGGNIMYFPMSSVSLADSELGEHDMKKRTLAPFGIIEPLLWLLHMQGFCMFEDAGEKVRGE